MKPDAHCEPAAVLAQSYGETAKHGTSFLYSSLSHSHSTTE